VLGHGRRRGSPRLPSPVWRSPPPLAEEQPRAAARSASNRPRPNLAQLLSPAEFSEVVSEPETVTINVHVPYEDEIPGTDSFIPFDRVDRRRAELPPRSSPIGVYCRTGPMSATAARTLQRLGYRDVYDLRGGMRAWRTSGRPIDHRRG